MAQQIVSETTSVLILSDLPLLAMGIRASLAALPGVEASVHCPHESDLAATIQREDPGLVIVATACGPSPICTGGEAFPERSGRRWLWLSPDEPGEASAGGLHGLSLRTLDPSALRQVLCAALRGLGEGQPSTARNDTRRGQELRSPSVAGGAQLSARELEIGHLVAEGFSSQEIARRLFISPRTVEKHRANLMAKLGVTNAAALARELIFRAWARETPSGRNRHSVRRAS